MRTRMCLMSLAVCLGLASDLSAQATRTWVSGVGDDANPCSRTAPCKTFAGAISKTAAGGEIDALDPGGFGAVTITKSITIDGGGTLASILASNTNGVVISASSTDVVVLRNLSISGAGTTAGLDTRGVKFLAGQKLVIENCDISNFQKRGISIESSTANAEAFVTNTTVHGGANNGIVVNPPATVNNLVLNRVRVVGNGYYGIGINPGSKVDISDSVFTGNLGGGIHVDGVDAAVSIDSTLIAGSDMGLDAVNGSMVRLSRSTITRNDIGVFVNGGTIWSYGDNRIAGNASGNGPISGTIAHQ